MIPARNTPVSAVKKPIIAAVLVSGVLAGACAAEPQRSLPGPAVVDVKMSEYSFEFARTKLKAGRVLFKARNTGELSHQMVLATLPPDTPPILEQLRSPDRKIVSQIASFQPRPPGATAAFAVDFTSGRYALICFVQDPDGKQHSVKGMATEFIIK